MPTKIVFLGTPDLAVPFLEALINESDFEIQAVITQPDRPVGRKQILTPSPVKEFALSKKLPIFEPENLRGVKGAEGDERVKGIFFPLSSADIAVVVAYGIIIPQTVLDLPWLGFLNVHPSLLPKYRGPSPIQSAIANGDEETGISIMLLNKGMDTGPILAQEKIILVADETQFSLTEKIKQLGPALLVETIKKYVAGEIKPQPQDDSQAVICKMLSRDSGKIDWSESVEKIDQKIRAYFPWPGSWTEILHNGKTLRLKILKSKLQNNVLTLLEVQPEGRAPMAYEEFVKGYGPLKMVPEKE